MTAKVIPLDPVKRKVSKDICPKCTGELDTGWECNDCGFDASELATAPCARAAAERPSVEKIEGNQSWE